MSIMKPCSKCGGTYEIREGERVCLNCGNRPDVKSFPDVIEEIARADKPVQRGRTRQSPLCLTEDERVAIVNEGRERGWKRVATERGITPQTLYNWRDNLREYGLTRIRGLVYHQPKVPELHPMVVSLLAELPPLDSKPSQTLLDGFARAFSGILTVIYMKED